MRSTFKVLGILQEECGETIVVASKIKRFGPKSFHPDDPQKTNRQLLAQELGDIVAMIHVLIHDTDLGITARDISRAKARKLKKLEKWLPHKPKKNATTS